VPIFAGHTYRTNSKKLLDIGRHFGHGDDIVAEILSDIECIECQVIVRYTRRLKIRIVEKHISIQVNGCNGTCNH
jgi:hypothetical protein